MAAKTPVIEEISTQGTDFKGLLNEGMNMAAGVGYYVLNPTLRSAAIIGTVVGAFFGLGAHLGLLQGIVWALYRECIHIPIREYLSANGGEGDGKIRPQTRDFITCAVEIGSMVLPILLTAYCGHGFGAFLSHYVVTQCLVHTGAVYTLFSGLVIWAGLYGTLAASESTLTTAVAEAGEK